MTLAGEYFTGSNLDDYFGGVGQGVNSSSKADLREIRSNGGWAALRFIANPSSTFSIGAGIDNPNDNDLTAMADARSKNQTIFASVINKITPSFILGLQISEWQTDYKNATDSKAFRAQTSLTYKF